MTYLKRNINLLLLVIVILVVGFNLALMAYFQFSYKGVTSKYYDRAEAYEVALLDLQEREAKLNETSNELTRKTIDKNELERQYTQVDSENDQLSSQVSTLSKDLQVTKAELSTTKSKLSEKEVELTVLNKKFEVFDEEVPNLDEEITDISNKLVATHGLTQEDVNTLLAEIKEIKDELQDAT